MGEVPGNVEKQPQPAHPKSRGGYIVNLQRQGGALAKLLPNLAPNELRGKHHARVQVIGRYLDVKDAV